MARTVDNLQRFGLNVASARQKLAQATSEVNWLQERRRINYNHQDAIPLEMLELLQLRVALVNNEVPYPLRRMVNSKTTQTDEEFQLKVIGAQIEELKVLAKLKSQNIMKHFTKEIGDAQNHDTNMAEYVRNAIKPAVDPVYGHVTNTMNDLKPFIKKQFKDLPHLISSELHPLKDIIKREIKDVNSHHDKCTH